MLFHRPSHPTTRYRLLRPRRCIFTVGSGDTLCSEAGRLGSYVHPNVQNNN